MPGKPQPVEPRFWSNVQKLDGCWLWTGSKTPKGYGQISVEGRLQYAHRVAWRLQYGSWPRGILCHSCDTPACVKPAHLQDGTHKQNGEEASERGLIAFGERSGPARLSRQDVQRLLELHAQGQTQASIARELGVAPSNVSRIVRGERRVHYAREI